MQRSAKTVGGAALTIAASMVVITLAMPGCIDQNQDNSPISVSTAQGRLVLSVACSGDGSVAYVTDGRNVYRYDRSTSVDVGSWACILSQGERLKLAATHDPREPVPSDDAQEKTAPAQSDAAGAANAGK